MNRRSWLVELFKGFGVGVFSWMGFLGLFSRAPVSREAVAAYAEPLKGLPFVFASKDIKASCFFGNRFDVISRWHELFELDAAEVLKKGYLNVEDDDLRVELRLVRRSEA